MKSVLISLLLLLVGGWANATEVCWVNATENEDGSPYTDPGSTTVEYGTVVNEVIFGTKLGEVTVGPTDTCVTIELLAGNYAFRAYHTNLSGTNSRYSNNAFKDVQLGVPSSPQMTTITDKVYSFTKTKNRFVLAPVGTIPAGTPCLTAQRLIDNTQIYGVVDRALVDWDGLSRPQVVFAPCSE